MSIFMDIGMMRKQLINYINRLDEHSLEKIYTMLEKEIISADNKYDEVTLKLLYERVANDEQGNSKSYTVEEAMKSVKDAYNIKK